ncbi:hypothetical protein [Hymenobacter sp. YC55]|uniref:hypothetical protein n=1 Tax=Hymenobacter sp. YC55 TaxID=3034019 RepID=UPI0023F70F80|nr:hypothetical protein [Hymenobacter sp. YC55]MDF7814171.1 hypothetical protein [Hymenobacter sp. YC55]
MASLIPPVNTPAWTAFLDQGTNFYPGVDQWLHPKHDLPAGTLLVQFDFRPEADIRQGEATVSAYFTDAATLLKHLTPTQEVKARDLAEALQVKPYRQADIGEHLYSPRVAVYRVLRPIKAASVIVAQPAEYGQGLTRNNIQYGAGVGTQFFLTQAKDSLLKGVDAPLALVDVMPCIEREHRLAWLQRLERSQVDNKAIEAAIKPLFQNQVNELLRGTSGERKHGREIAKLYLENQQQRTLAPATPTTQLPTPRAMETNQSSILPLKRRGPRL